MVGRIREILFDEGVDVDGVATLAASQDYVDDKFLTQGALIIDPHGWTEYDNTYMTRSWVGTTFTLTQVGSSTPYFCKGALKQLVGNKSITVNPTAGPHWIALNCATEQLEDFTSFPVAQALSTHIITEFYYASGVVILYNANERHTTKFPKRVWVYNHYYLSTQYRSGITPSMTSIDGNGSSIDHARFSVTAGIVSDEDIDIDIAALTSSAAKTIWYYRPDLTLWVSYSETNGTGVVPFGGTGRASYNSYSTGAGLIECTNNYHVLTHLFAANNGTLIAIMGNNQYQQVADARLAASTEIATLLTQGLPFPEFRAIATFINKTSNTYSNAVKSAILSVDTGVSYIDWRKTALNPVAGQNATSHNNLTSLQGGQSGEYYHLTNADYLNIINKIFPGGAASDTGAKLLFPTKAGLAGITPTAGNAVYDSAAKKLYVGDGSVMKVVGGGLIPENIDKTRATALESGKHYLYDGSGMTADVTLTLPAIAAELVVEITVYNIPVGYKLIIDGNGSEVIFYNDTDNPNVEFRTTEGEQWAKFTSNTTKWLVNDGVGGLGGYVSGPLTVTGAFTPSGGIVGKTDGLAVAAGDVGEQKIATYEGAVGSSGVYTDTCTITLTKGIWKVGAGAMIQRNGATISSFEFRTFIIPTAGNSLAGYFAGVNGMFFDGSVPTTFTFFSVSHPEIIVISDGTNLVIKDGRDTLFTATQVLRFKHDFIYTSGSPLIFGFMQAIRKA
jgi:hypothetical protein